MSGYIVRIRKAGEYLYVNDVDDTPMSFRVCERPNDAHQFQQEAAAEAIAFLAGGEHFWYDHWNNHD